MDKISYPELEPHKKQHKNIINSMNDFTKKLTKMNMHEIEKELAHHVEVWFIHHIIYQDKKISQWLLTHEIPEYTFKWKNSYSINNAIIDAEHQELFKIASEAFKNVPEDQKMQKIKDTLLSLYEYFKKHFRDEENYMAEIKYDKIENHKKAHEQIINDLNNFIKKFPAMKIYDIEDTLKDFIDVALVKHIIEDDRKIFLWTKFLEDLKHSKELKEL